MRNHPQENAVRKSLRAMTSTAVLLAALFVTAGPPSKAPSPTSQPQATTTDLPVFEAASIKGNKSAQQNQNLGLLTLPGGLWRATNITLRPLIASTYFHTFTKARFVLGGPSWIDSEHFDIEARAEGNPGMEQKRLMIQSLLESRFKLIVHHETRQLPVFALVLSKPGEIGPQLVPHSNDAKCTDPAAGPPPPPGPGEQTPAFCGGFFMSARPGTLRESGNNVSMDMFAAMLIQSVDRPVLDRTGLSGAFDLTLDFAPVAGPGSQSGASDPSAPPSIFTAVQEQLGLKLESTTGPVDVLVIDHVEEPMPN